MGETDKSCVTRLTAESVICRSEMQMDTVRDPCRQTLYAFAAVDCHGNLNRISWELPHKSTAYLDFSVVWDSRLTVDGLHEDLPYAVLVTFHWVRLPVPIVYPNSTQSIIRGASDLLTEFANEVGSLRSWRPLPVQNIIVGLHIQAKCLVALRELVEAAFRFVDSVDPFLVVSVAAIC